MYSCAQCSCTEPLKIPRNAPRLHVPAAAGNTPQISDTSQNTLIEPLADVSFLNNSP